MCYSVQRATNVHLLYNQNVKQAIDTQTLYLILPERFDWSIMGWTILRLAFINLSADRRSKHTIRTTGTNYFNERNNS